MENAAPSTTKDAMAIAEIAEYAHLSDEDVERLAFDLDLIRRDVEKSLGASDATYIRRAIAFQRILDVAARVVIARTRSRGGWWAGTLGLAYAKSVENMELGHNIGHGQWDWMNDPEIHSSTWEWDMVGSSAQWRYSHNYRHHMNSNIVGVDDDLGFGVMRVTRDQPWERQHLIQPLRNLLLAAVFEWGIGLHDFYSERDRVESPEAKSEERWVFIRKIARQTGKDYVLVPALSGRRWRRTLGANVTANLLRNVWTNVVILCGHFPDGAHKFDEAVLEDETRGEWYLRQMLGAANFTAGRAMAFSTGGLCYQIEHHLFPELPSNRHHEISLRVRGLCEEYGLPYSTASLPRQYFSTLRTIHRLAVPDDFRPVRRLRERLGV